MNSINKIKLFLISFFWFIKLEEDKAFKKVLAKTDLDIADIAPNRKFLKEWEGKGIYKSVNFILRKVVYYGRNRNGKMVIVMSLPDPNAAVIATLNLEGDHDKDLAKMKLIRTKCTGNMYVVTPLLVLTALDGLILAFENAHGAARKATLTPCVEALNDIMYQFQKFSNLPVNKANSIVIIQSGGFHVKGVGTKPAQIWEATQSEIAGEILLTAVVWAASLCCYDWWYSINGTDWIRMDPTVHAHTHKSGLVPNTFVWFKYQVVIDAGPQGFSTEIKIQVPA